MKITLAQRHLFNDSKPIMEIKGVDGKIQWDECDLSECPPYSCLLYTSPSPRDLSTSRMPSSA